MRISTPTAAVNAIGELNISGNVIPATWWGNIRLSSGKPDSTAIVLLSEIVYWYRPAEVRDEHTGELKGSRKRFHGDKLQRSYQSFADQFGFSKREATDALKRLRDAGLITLELRTVITAEGLALSNILFIEVIPDAIKAITHPSVKISSGHKNVTPTTLKRNSPYVETEPLLRSDVTPPTLKSETYTETTTEIKNKTPLPPTGGISQEPAKKSKFDPLTEKPSNVSAEVWADWVSHRKEIRHPLTPTTCKRIRSMLENHVNPDAVISLSIERGWQGLFPEKITEPANTTPAFDVSRLTEEQRRELALYELLEGR